MTRYCLVCGKEWGPYYRTCCTEGSLVATKVEGLFKKKRSYFTLEGKPLGQEQLDEIKRIATTKFKERKNECLEACRSRPAFKWRCRPSHRKRLDRGTRGTYREWKSRASQRFQSKPRALESKRGT